jgi:signal transduction histidine kinase
MAEKQPLGEHALTQVIATLCLLFILLASAYLIFFKLTLASINTGYSFKPLFGMASAVILTGLAALYWYAAKFYHDSFYRLLSVGWLVNGIYIFFETFVKQPPDVNKLDFSLSVYVIGIITSLPVYVASFIPKDEQPNYRDLTKSIAGWAVWFVGTLLLSYWVAITHFPNWLPYDPVKTEAIQFAFITLSGIPFAMWTLVRVGRCLRTRLDRDRHKKWAVIFPGTFYVWAILQPLYLLKLVPSMGMVIYVIFVLALIPKLVNGLGALAIVNDDFAHAQEKLLQRSVLEDLGALTTSIEHDVKNPLEFMNSELERMRIKFKNDTEVMPFVERLEEQKARIAAIAGIIPVIRGERAYYEKYMEKTNVGDLINRCIKAVKVEKNTQNISFRTWGKPLYIKAHRQMIEQAVVNILRNSVEAIRKSKRPHGVVEIAVKVDIKDAKFIRIDFTDNGCGIAEEELKTVTTLFMSTKSKDKPNSGIGLFITDRIMRFHRGRLEILSDVDKGTTASLLLPAWEDGAKQPQKPAVVLNASSRH